LAKQNMGKSVTMIERHYGQTRVLVGIEYQTARRVKKPIAYRPGKICSKATPVPEGAVDPTSADDDVGGDG
jgi:hypothetical protein